MAQMHSQGEHRMNKSNIRVAALAVALALAGCSSVPLNDVPVDNKGATPNTGTQTPATKVEPVTTGSDASQNQGPQNVARLIYFDFDSYVIKPDYQSIVDGHAR